MLRLKLRGVVALLMLFLWTVVAISGYLIYISPSGPRSGKTIIFLLTKSEWIDVHFYTAILAGLITIVHIIIDYRTLKACVNMLVKR
ncbi:MAG: DUF4405 domain-containing protein [Archaeoglobales archaeon]|nr:DUF4405 domain-containing protein [Archaeoglobales archaeon]